MIFAMPFLQHSVARNDYDFNFPRQYIKTFPLSSCHLVVTMIQPEYLVAYHTQVSPSSSILIFPRAFASTFEVSFDDFFVEPVRSVVDECTNSFRQYPSRGEPHWPIWIACIEKTSSWAPRATRPKERLPSRIGRLETC